MQDTSKIIAFKVLNGLESCNGGKMTWKVGEWQTVEGDLEMCSRGLHLTIQPKKWQGRDIYYAEGRNVIAWNDDKILCRSVRLIKKARAAAYEAYRKAVAPADEAYRKAVAAAYEAYEKAVAAAYEAYRKAVAAADEAYEKAVAAADEAYRKFCLKKIRELAQL